MTTPTVTLLYAGLLAILSMALSFQAGRMRAQTGISLGDGGNEQMLVAMRRHANFVEYVPMILILLVLLEMNEVGALAIHGLGGALVVFRICHAIGLGPSMQSPLRGIGAAGTALVLVVSAVWAVITFF